MSDEPKEIMTQEDIDSYLSSVRAKEEPEKGQNRPVSQLMGAEEMENEPSGVGDAVLISQDDIDALLNLNQQGGVDKEESLEQATGQKETGTVSQDDIDALLNLSQQVEEASQSQEQRETGTVSQDDIDALISRQQAEQGKDRAGISDNDPGSGGVQPYNKANEDEGKKVWETLDQSILSQEEIDALLSGFVKTESASFSAVEAEPACAGQDQDLPDKADNITAIHRNEYEERLRQKEEYIIRRRQKAAAMVNEILRSEEARINSIMAIKGKVVNENLFARYEIIRADRTKMIVSISDNTIQEYRQMHPDYCMHRC